VTASYGAQCRGAKTGIYLQMLFVVTLKFTTVLRDRCSAILRYVAKAEQIRMGNP